MSVIPMKHLAKESQSFPNTQPAALLLPGSPCCMGNSTSHV